MAGSSFEQMLQAAAQTTGDSPQENNAAAMAQSVKNDFESWKSTYYTQGIGQGRRQELDQYSAEFEKVVDKAAAQGGYSDPQAFLKTLSTPELAALQHVHSLADPIDPDNLTKEGALNLLYSPDQAKDIDHDGFEMVGKAKTWTFPPVDAPDSVKKAWKQATSGMDGGDALLMACAFMPVVDPNSHAAVSAYLGPDADYEALARKALDGMVFSGKYDQSWQQETRAKQIKGLEAFLNNLQSAS